LLVFVVLLVAVSHVACNPFIQEFKKIFRSGSQSKLDKTFWR